MAYLLDHISLHINKSIIKTTCEEIIIYQENSHQQRTKLIG